MPEDNGAASRFAGERSSMTSVIIVNYHSARLASRAVESVLKDEKNIEAIVVDNTATDEERTELRALLEEKGVTLILNERNEGFARACNQAFFRSKGEFLFLINPDAYTVSPCIGVLRNFLEEHPKAGAVSPQVFWDKEMSYYFPLYPVFSPSRELVSRFADLSRLSRLFFSLNERRRNLHLWRSSLPVKVNNLTGGTVMVRRSSLECSGGLFDERFFLFYEDADLFLRLRKSGYRLFILPAAKAVHNHYHGNEKLAIMAQTLPLYVDKHYKKSSLMWASSAISRYRGPDGYVDHGGYDSPPLFPIPRDLEKGYLFEWSPSPLFVPSVGCFEEGKTFTLSDEVWNLLDRGVYYSRVSSRSRFFTHAKTYCWTKN
jgi:GT2 family glycosyltransferase